MAHSLSLWLCLLTFAVVVHCAPGESPVEEQVVMLQEGAAPKDATIQNAMKSIPKSILALAAGKKPAAAKQPAVAAHAARVKQQRAPSTAQAVHALVTQTAATVQANMAKPQAAPHIRMPRIRPPKSVQAEAPPLPSLASFATPHIERPEVHLKVEASDAMASMQKLLRQNHIAVAKAAPHVEKAAAPHVEKAAAVPKAKPNSKVTMGESAMSTAQRLRADVKGEMKHSISLKDPKPQNKKLATNSLGVIDGSNNSWQPFENKVPKKALNPKRTFLPVTQQAFHAPSQNFKTPTVDSIVKSLHAAETQRAQQQAAIMKPAKTVDVKSLDYGKDQTLLKPTESKTDSLAWPFGKPDFEVLLQKEVGDTNEDENQKDPEGATADDDDEDDDEDDEGDEDDDKADLGEANSNSPQPKTRVAAPPAGEGTPIMAQDYDPIKDMMKANGWTASMMHKPAPMPVPNNQPAASSAETTNNNNQEEGDEDED